MKENGIKGGLDMYNIDKDFVIAEFENDGENELHFSETLYFSKTDGFYLFCEGGSETRYAKKVSANIWVAAEHFIPLDERAAYRFALRNLDEVEFVEYAENFFNINKEA